MSIADEGGLFELPSRYRELQAEASELAASVAARAPVADEADGSRPGDAAGIAGQPAGGGHRRERVRWPVPPRRLTGGDSGPRGAGRRERPPRLAVRDAGHRQLRRVRGRERRGTRAVAARHRDA